MCSTLNSEVQTFFIITGYHLLLRRRSKKKVREGGINNRIKEIKNDSRETFLVTFCSFFDPFFILVRVSLSGYVLFMGVFVLFMIDVSHFVFLRIFTRNFVIQEVQQVWRALWGALKLILPL